MVGKTSKRAILLDRFSFLAEIALSSTSAIYIYVGIRPRIPPKPRKKLSSPRVNTRTSAGGAKYLRFALAR